MSAYNPKEIESKWYPFWLANGHFNADEHTTKENKFVVMMPPPNVTGRLHMGHALQDTVQDILTRTRRMQGYEALWMPGQDHAGIATQNVVEKELKKNEKKNRHDLGREKFVEKVWEWKEEYGDIILQQKHRLGISPDWRRARFTLDEKYVHAVQTVFVQLYEAGLLYRGAYMVNWCPQDLTALSDEEVDNVERDSFLWYIRYELENGEFLTVATQRPETIFGDLAIAVNPADERYQHLVGTKAKIPLIDKWIPIIADDYVKIDFGAGALKVTPNHDKNDFEIAKRHHLGTYETLNPNGTLNHLTPYEGQDRFKVRAVIEADLEAAGLLAKKEAYKSILPISSRSGVVVEPRISTQWFVKMQPLADEALKVVRDGTVKFYPQRWENDYFRWLDNIRDWCISRQLWWGHRIPAWYHTHPNGEIDETKPFIVAIEQPEAGMVQDNDVLDTWFSSWLWPFATLGWTEETDALKAFYPGTVLVSGYDILFFWIARMVMGGLFCMKEVPFKEIYITGIIRDKNGKKMSKSAGNGIDPLDMIEQYGADAVRFSLTVLCSQGQDIKLDPTKFEMGRNFANKIWNAFKVFAPSLEALQLSDLETKLSSGNSLTQLNLADKWMLHRINETIKSLEEDLSAYRLNEMALKVYDLFWGDFCDWYLELVKPPCKEKMSAEEVLKVGYIYEQLLKLLHPFMPFVTEDLWHQMGKRAEGASISVSTYPIWQADFYFPEAAQAFGLIQEMVSGIRNVRSNVNLLPSQKIEAVISVGNQDEMLKSLIEEHALYFQKLAKVEKLTVALDAKKPKASAAVIVGRHQVFVPLAGLIDLQAEKERLQKEIAAKQGFLKSVEAKLANEAFVARAPEKVIEIERKKQADAQAEVESLTANLQALN